MLRSSISTTSSTSSPRHPPIPIPRSINNNNNNVSSSCESPPPPQQQLPVGEVKRNHHVNQQSSSCSLSLSSKKKVVGGGGEPGLLLHHHHPTKPSTSGSSGGLVGLGGGGLIGYASSSSNNHNNSSPRTSASRALSTDFQSLKLDSISPVEENGGGPKTLVHALQKDNSNPANQKIYSKQQVLDMSSGSLDDFNDSDSYSTSSSCSEEDSSSEIITRTIFQQQVKFFCQMKEFLLSQQMALRHQLEALNNQVTNQKKRGPHPHPSSIPHNNYPRPPRRRRHPHLHHLQRLLPPQTTSLSATGLPLPSGSPSGSSTLHIPSVGRLGGLGGTPSEGSSEQGVSHETVPHMFSCSSAGRSDLVQCPICGIELDVQDNPELLEDHVIGHWS